MLHDDITTVMSQGGRVRLRPLMLDQEVTLSEGGATQLRMLGKEKTRGRVTCSYQPITAVPQESRDC